MNEISLKLRERIDIIEQEILGADRCVAMSEAIRVHAKRLNQHPSKDTFGFLQSLLSERYNLHIVTLFESQNSRYDTISIPSTLTYIEKHKSDLAIVHREDLIEWLNSQLREVNIGPNSEDSELTMKMIESYREILTVPQYSNILDQLKYIRDKHIAHRENILPDEVRDVSPTWQEADSLLAFAKEFMGNIGCAYLNAPYLRSERGYHMTEFAERMGQRFDKFLQMACQCDFETAV